MREPHPLLYETWKEQDRPTCPDCERPVLYGYKHYCVVREEMVLIEEPDEWPL